MALATHPPPSAKVKERAELYVYSHSVFMAGYRVKFTLLHFTEVTTLLQTTHIHGITPQEDDRLLTALY